MSFAEIAGRILQGMGPGLLQGIGNALTDHQHEHDHDRGAPDPKDDSTAKPNSFATGGVVEKTGVALVHKGETVIPKAKQETVNLSHHRVVMHLNKGGLHRALGIPENEKIPLERIQQARDSKNPHVREMANLAHSMASWHHK